MIESIYVKIALVVLGVLVIASSLVNIQDIVTKILFRSKTKAQQDKQTEFLEIISLWYQLKNKCDQFKLTVASDKLDEVFPLLNEVLDNEKTS